MAVPRDPTDRRRRVTLFVVLFAAFVARVGWSMSRPADDAFIDQLPDQREYLAIARNVLAGEGFQFFDPRFVESLHAFRTPLYPAFVAACGGRVRLVQLAQAALDTSTVLAAYLLARALTNPEAARRVPPLAAAALVASNPFLIYFCALVLSETLFTAMLAWGMLFLVIGPRGARLMSKLDGPGEPGRPRPVLGTFVWLAGGLLLASAALVRPSAAPLAVVMGYGAAFVSQNRARHDAYQGDRKRRTGLRWPLPVGTTMLLLTLLVLLPWAYRNHRVLGRWVWTTSNGGVTLYDGLHPDATGASDQSFLRGMPALRSMGELGRSDYLADKAKQFAREHPGRALELAAIKVGRTWSPVPLSREYGGWRNRLIGLVYGVPFYLLVLAGLWDARLSRAAKAFLLLPAIFITAVHALSVGSLRYRIPAEPPMAVIAGSVFYRPKPKWKRAGEDDEEGGREA